MITNLKEAKNIIERAFDSLNIDRYDLILSAWLLKSNPHLKEKATQAVQIHYRGVPEDLKPLFLAFLNRTNTHPILMNLEDEKRFYANKISKFTILLQRYYDHPHKFEFMWPKNINLIWGARGPRVKVNKQRRSIIYEPYKKHHLLGMVYAFGDTRPDISKEAYKTLKTTTNLTPKGILYEASQKYGKSDLQRL
jgi:hypothetical protein